MTRPEVHHGTHQLKPLPFGPFGAGVQVVAVGDWLLAGWSVLETTGLAVAAAELYDGSTAGGLLVGVVQVPSGQASSAFFGGHLLHIGNGLAVNVLSGTLKGVLYAADL